MKRWSRTSNWSSNASRRWLGLEELVRQHNRRVFNICYRFTVTAPKQKT